LLLIQHKCIPPDGTSVTSNVSQSDKVLLIEKKTIFFFHLVMASGFVVTLQCFFNHRIYDMSCTTYPNISNEQNNVVQQKFP